MHLWVCCNLCDNPSCLSDDASASAGSHPGQARDGVLSIAVPGRMGQDKEERGKEQTYASGSQICTHFCWTCYEPITCCLTNLATRGCHLGNNYTDEIRQGQTGKVPRGTQLMHSMCKWYFGNNYADEIRQGQTGKVPSATQLTHGMCKFLAIQMWTLTWHRMSPNPIPCLTCIHRWG